MKPSDQKISTLVASRNAEKTVFTAGPASLLPENLTGLRPCFGRGDSDYAAVEEQVMASIQSLTGLPHLVRMQGSASLALEIMALNFLCGRVLVVQTGYYSERLAWLAASAQRRTGAVSTVETIPWNDLDAVAGRFDWVFACYTETSCGLLLPIEMLSSLCRRVGARLMLDATASIGLEQGHEQADAMAFSSCKGLFGLTGASFLAYRDRPNVEVDSFYLRLETHLERRMTGPYHAICSLLDVLPRHSHFREAVVENKKRFMTRMKDVLSVPPDHQPLLCTHVTCDLTSDDSRVVLYKPRGIVSGSVVCHLGEVHLGSAAEGKILDALTRVMP